MPKEIFEPLNADWAKISKKLYGFAIYCSKINFFDRWNSLPKGYTHEDVVQDAIRRAVSKNWSDCSQEDLEKYLLGAVRSVISNLARHDAAQRKMIRSLTIGKQKDLFTNNIEDDMDYRNMISELDKELNGDDVLKSIFKEVRLGNKSGEIAINLGIPVKDVYNAKKRLIRVVDEISKNIRNHDGR